MKLITQDYVIDEISLTDIDIKNGIEIEDIIVSKVKAKHDIYFIKSQDL